MSDGGVASTTYYGVTVLSNSTNSTSTTMAATPSAVKSAYDLASSKVGEWTLIDTKTGQTAVNLPSSFTELLCIAKVDNNSSINIPILIPKVILTTSDQGFNGGYAGSSINVAAAARITAKTTTATLSYAYLNGGNKLSTTKVTYYYR